jgi:hypothetical protein
MNIFRFTILFGVVTPIILIYIHKLRTDSSPLSDYTIAYYLYSKVLNFLLPRTIAKKCVNKYFFYIIRTSQKLNNINVQVPLLLKPSILCIQFDDRKGITFVDNSKKNNSFACKYFGFKYHFSDKSFHDIPYINKLIYLRQQMQTECDYVMWIDSDAYICPSFDANIIINNYPDAALLISRDPEFVYKQNLIEPKGHYPVFCAGVFIVKNNSIGLEMLEFMIEHLTKPEKIKMYKKLDPEKTWAGFLYEQGIMNVAIRKYRKHCALLHFEYLNNSPHNLNENSWVIHAMGKNCSERSAISLKVMKLWEAQRGRASFECEGNHQIIEPLKYETG